MVCNSGGAGLKWNREELIFNRWECSGRLNVMIAYDNDTPGIKGAEKLKAFGDRIIFYPPPGIGDVNDYYNSTMDGNILPWIEQSFQGREFALSDYGGEKAIDGSLAMNAIQEAKEYAELISQGFSKTEVAKRKQVDLKRVRWRLAWLELPREVQKLVADGDLQSNVRVAEALLRLPLDRQVREARRFASRNMKIEQIEEAVNKMIDSLMIEQAGRYERLSDGRLFLPVVLAEDGLNGTQKRKLTDEAISAARNVCELCSLYSSPELCRPCPLVTMLVVLMRRK